MPSSPQEVKTTNDKNISQELKALVVRFYSNLQQLKPVFMSNFLYSGVTS